MTKQMTPSQALLVLMDNYRDKESEIVLGKLKKLYLVGPQNAQDFEEFDEFLKDPILKEYTITVDKEAINNDPTRRYFETHLALETLRGSVSNIDKKILKDFLTPMEKSLMGYWQHDYPQLDDIENVGNLKDPTSKEYAYSIEQVKNVEAFSSFSQEDKESLILLLKCGYAGAFSAGSGDKSGNRLPLDIYSTGFYHPKQRGKETKRYRGDEKARSRNLGLVKGHMPVSADDEIFYEGADYHKPSEQGVYIENTGWVEENFKALVHPYSNSISGTALAVLRNLAKFQQEGAPSDESIISSDENMRLFYKTFVSVMLFNAGGHTLNEFCYPLTLEPVQIEFSMIDGFSELSLETLFLTDNEKSFDNALEKSIKYNNQLLKKTTLNDEIGVKPRDVNSNEMDKKAEEIRAELEKTEGEFRNKKEELQKNGHEEKTKFYNSNVETLKQDIEGIVNKSNERVSRQFQYKRREGYEKSRRIEELAGKIKENLNNGDIELAMSKANELSQKLESIYGKTNFSLTGEKKSKAYETAEEIGKLLTNFNDKVSKENERIDTNNQELIKKEEKKYNEKKTEYKEKEAEFKEKSRGLEREYGKQYEEKVSTSVSKHKQSHQNTFSNKDTPKTVALKKSFKMQCLEHKFGEELDGLVGLCTSDESDSRVLNFPLGKLMQKADELANTDPDQSEATRKQTVALIIKVLSIPYENNKSFGETDDVMKFIEEYNNMDSDIPENIRDDIKEILGAEPGNLEPKHIKDNEQKLMTVTVETVKQFVQSAQPSR